MPISILVLLCASAFLWAMAEAVRMSWKQGGWGVRLFLVLLLFWGTSTANLALFHIICGCLGGTVEAGRIDGERRFLGTNGRYTEVSRTVYGALDTYGRASRGLAISAWVLMALVAAADAVEKRRTAHSNRVERPDVD